MTTSMPVSFFYSLNIEIKLYFSYHCRLSKRPVNKVFDTNDRLNRLFGPRKTAIFSFLLGDIAHNCYEIVVSLESFLRMVGSIIEFEGRIGGKNHLEVESSER